MRLKAGLNLKCDQIWTYPNDVKIYICDKQYEISVSNETDYFYAVSDTNELEGK